MSSARAIIKSLYAIGIVTGPTEQQAKVSGTMGASILGPVMTLDKVDQLGIDVKWTSSNAVGVISVQGTNDPLAASSDAAIVANAHWNDITFSPGLTQPASNNGGYMISMALIPYTYTRVKYTRTSGTGNMVVYISAKGL